MASVKCPHCKISDSEVKRTWSVIFHSTEMRLRTHYCKACGVKFRSYEFTFDSHTSKDQITEIIEGALTFYPPVIKPYRWSQGNLFKNNKI